jgi:hypothetical protein
MNSDKDCGGELRKKSDGKDCVTCHGRGCMTSTCSNFALWEPLPGADSALTIQVGGGHYKKLRIQPVEYIFLNNIGYMEGSAIKYLTRWRDKNGIEDLKKAKHFIDLLIEMESKNAAR